MLLSLACPSFGLHSLGDERVMVEGAWGKRAQHSQLGEARHDDDNSEAYCVTACDTERYLRDRQGSRRCKQMSSAHRWKD